MIMLTDEEVVIAVKAKNYVVGITQDLIDRYVSDRKPRKKGKPVSIFMAGSAGAGKTEYSKNFISNEFANFENVIRIDADEIRDLIPAYKNGECTANVTVPACTKGVHILHDYAISKGFDLILDGTFSHLQMALSNIKRSLDHKRIVEIYYIYQEPLEAWKLTQDREKVERRLVSKEFFIDSFIGSKGTVDLVMKQFQKRVSLNVILQDRRSNKAKIWMDVSSIDKTDVPTYSKEQLIELIV